MALNHSPEFKFVIVQIALVATLFIGPEAKQHSYEVQTTLSQGYRRSWRFKIFLLLALAAILLTGMEAFKLFWY